jgi:hypothetical protein
MAARNVCNSNNVISELLESEGQTRSALIFENIRKERDAFNLPPLVPVLNSQNALVLWSKFTDTDEHFSQDSALLEDDYVDLNEFSKSGMMLLLLLLFLLFLFQNSY